MTEVRLSSNQRKVVEFEEGPIAVIAGPGSGKTRVLTERIRRLLTKVPGHFRVLALTFVESAGVSITRIDHARSAQGARAQVEQQNYDILILDLVLPANDKSKDARPDVGYELLQELSESGAATRIVGATAHVETIAVYEQGFRDRTEQLLLVSPDSSAWRDSLHALLQQVAAASERPLGHDVDVCFITALKDTEYPAVVNLPVAWEAEKILANYALYRKGTIELDGKLRTVVLANTKQMGMVSACHLTQLLISEFRPRVIMMTGICGGLSAEVSLGDLVVADKSWDWQSGKWTGAGKFSHAPDQKDASRELVVSIKAVESEAPEIAKGLVHLTSPSRQFRIVEGPMLSGSAVVASDAMHEMFVAQHRKAVAIDMECYGVYYASHYAAEPKPRYVCLKAVSDMAGAEKANDYQAYCSALSAAVAVSALKKYFAEVT
ncbi:UvrD-helicase domain-containing protein [Variovorax sp. CCNWLW225]|uniref:phosphorylase family protein n=1 Tax=Variovorax sp. CCNWLW225 TaxID=3127462 RepID=UPI003076A4CD